MWDQIDRRLRKLEADVAEALRLLRLTLKGELIIMTTQAQFDAALADLKAEVARETSVEQSAIALINGIPKIVADAVAAFQAANPGVDTSGLTAVSDQIAAQRAELAAAVVANTPAAPAAPADPAPAPAPATPPPVDGSGDPPQTGTP